jgi:hypothetical protein
MVIIEGASTNTTGVDIPFLGSLEGHGDDLKLFYDKDIIVLSWEVSPQAYRPNEELCFEP